MNWSDLCEWTECSAQTAHQNRCQLRPRQPLWGRLSWWCFVRLENFMALFAPLHWKVQEMAHLLPEKGIHHSLLHWPFGDSSHPRLQGVPQHHETGAAPSPTARAVGLHPSSRSVLRTAVLDVAWPPTHRGPMELEPVKRWNSTLPVLTKEQQAESVLFRFLYAC